MHMRWLSGLLVLWVACAAEPSRPASKPERGRPDFPDAKSFPPRAARFDPRRCNSAALRRVDPDYPAQAYRDRVEGWVLVSGLVDRDGLVRDPVVLAADPEDLFDENALRAFSKWRYCAPDRGTELPEVRSVVVFKIHR